MRRGKFLARLTTSDHAEQLVLKGGVLPGAFGTRRSTRDIDFAARDLHNDAVHVLGVVREIAALTPEKEDGLIFDSSGAAADVIRDVDQSSGVWVSMGVALATARTRFHIDVNVGDPIWPAPNHVEIPRLLGGAPLELVGYPLHSGACREDPDRGPTRHSQHALARDFGDV